MSGVFRDRKEYNRLRDKFETALEGVWPLCFKEVEVYKIENKADAIENLMVSSYILMKHIRAWLKRKKLDYTEAHSFPSLYNALERAGALFVHKNNIQSLAVEASILEMVSRSCYAWMKVYKMLDKKTERYSGYGCQCCKTKPALANTALCEDCGAQDDEPPANVIDGKGPFAKVDKDFPLPTPGGDMLETRRNISR